MMNAIGNEIQKDRNISKDPAIRIMLFRHMSTYFAPNLETGETIRHPIRAPIPCDDTVSDLDSDVSCEDKCRPTIPNSPDLVTTAIRICSQSCRKWTFGWPSRVHLASQCGIRPEESKTKRWRDIWKPLFLGPRLHFWSYNLWVRK